MSERAEDSDRGDAYWCVFINQIKAQFEIINVKTSD